MMMIEELPSPNKSKRLKPMTAIVIHDTGGKTAKGALEWMCSPKSKVSSHYLVGKDGTIYRLVSDSEIAWHAGTSLLHSEDNVNEFSIGIELVDDNDGDPYSDEQLASLFELCEGLCFTYKIPLNRVVGHQHIAVPKGRKSDPGRDFPWYEFLNTLGSRVAQKEIE